MLTSCRRLLGTIGETTIEWWKSLRYINAVVVFSLLAAFCPSHWSSGVRKEFSESLFVLGFRSLFVTAALAIFTGTVLVIQAAQWAQGVLRPDLLDALLVIVVARELAPLLANILVAARGGSQLCTKAALLKLSGDLDRPDANRGDPLVYLLMPQMYSAMIASLCLTVIFIVIAFVSGFLAGAVAGYISANFEYFLDDVFRELGALDYLVIAAKGLIPATFQSVIAFTQGLRVSSRQELAFAVGTASTKLLFVTLLLLTLISVLAYS